MSKVNFATREEFISISKVMKQLIHAGSFVISSYGCTWEVWIALEKIDLRLEQVLRFLGVLQASRVCYDSMMFAEA